MTDSPSQRWLDDFVRAFTALRPVDATFIGFHDHDHRLPDFSENGVGDRVATMEGLLARARRLEGERGSRATLGRRPESEQGSEATLPPGAAGAPSSSLTRVEALDLELAVGHLKLSMWETESGHFHRGNPSFFTGEAIFGVLSLFLSEFSPLSHRVDAAIRRLEAVPRFLKQARHWLAHGPGCHPAWTRRALRECDGALAFLGDGIDAVAAELLHPAPPLLSTDPGPMEAGVPRDPASLASGLHDAARTAARSFAEFRTFLAADEKPVSREVGCGPDVLDLHIREGHFLRERARDIASAAQEEMEATRAWLEEHARDFGARSPGEALAQLRELHPTPAEYLDRYREIWEDCRRVAVRENLVTWPDFPVRYLPRPRWARAAAPYLYFLFYRSPAAYRRPPVHPYLVAPLPEPLNGGAGHGGTGSAGGSHPVEEFLRTHNDAVIRANHVIHHGGLGHHVQNWHAFRSPSLIGRMAAVDGPARIAMHCGGTMAEGWACYATDLMAELAEAGVEGGMTRLEAYAERASRVRMCCRAIVDVELHTGRMDLDGAAAFYRENADMSDAAAMGEAVKNSMFPGMALMYHTGLREIHRVRQEVSAALGADFDLRTFHDRFLSWGSVPVTLAGELTRAALVEAGPSPVQSGREGG
ncbi:MAG: DUF885 family protein [Gemmatimonadales bacterium]|nr:MAG: DUF885 family protein [Gemmatimonadales bacterium]